MIKQESVKFCTYPKCQTTAGCAGVCARQNTTPQPRQWVGLTDEEVSDVIDDVLEGGGWLDVARALEAAIKDKNKW